MTTCSISRRTQRLAQAAFLLLTICWTNLSSLAQPAPADTTSAFASRDNPLLALPRHLWNFVMYPLGEFTIHAERSRLPERSLDFFMNDARTFGVFPKVQFGGETGTGGGVKIFHADLAGRRKQMELGYVYSGRRRQAGQFQYLDPSLAGTRGYALLSGEFLKTHNQNSSVNASVRDDPTRVFAINQVDAAFSLGWRMHTGRLAAARPFVELETTFGWHYRNFRADLGGESSLTDQGSSAGAALLPGIGEKLGYFSWGGRLVLDNRDHRPPVQEPPHPWFGSLPGERVLNVEGMFYRIRNTAYATRGGRVSLVGTYGSGADDVRFFKAAGEVQGYLPLFNPGQVLAVRGRLERVFMFGSSFAPYADLVTLGGGKEMRGFRRGFFRGEGSLLVNVEYRYLIWDSWNAFFFWDEGQVFDRFDEVSWTAFHSTFGGGVTLRTASRLLVKFQVGYSFAEKPLIGFSFAQDF